MQTILFTKFEMIILPYYSLSIPVFVHFFKNCPFETETFVSILNCYSSLLIVYEGEVGMPQVTVLGPSINIPRTCDDEYTRTSEENSRDILCYDADTSNSSIDYLSHDELSQDSHEKSFGEAAARGAKTNSFFPIPEDTVFLNSPPSFSINSSSPTSMDSWMVYSNSSSDEYSLGEHLNSSSSSNEETSDLELPLPHKNKRKCKLQFLDSELEEDDEVEDELQPALTTAQKRLCIDQSPVASTSDDSASNVDVRIIDFAHTSFARNSDVDIKTVHQGPDGGFLTGLDSLKRLLMHIMATENC